MVSVIANVKFPQIKPAHHAFISKKGTGTNIIRAMKNALDNLAKDERLKGKRAANLSPCMVTFTLDDFAAETEES